MSEISIKIVWLDTVFDRNFAKYIHRSLCEVDPYLITFRNWDKCISFIASLNGTENKVILIVSRETLTQSNKALLQRYEELLQLDSIYILKEPTAVGELITPETSNEMCNIYTDINLLCNDLSRISNLREHRHIEGFDCEDFVIVSSYNAVNLSGFTSTTVNQLELLCSLDSTKRQEPEFMYSSCLRDILINLESSEKEMIEFCRHKCAGNEADQNTIDQFEDYYDPITAIFWYTRPTFLYSLLNRALRDMDVDTLYSIRYFIKDLHSQLEQRHKLQQQSSTSLIQTETVFRGQLMETYEFNRKIRYNVNGFFSVCSFLSTTSRKDLAETYAGTGSISDGVQHILFEIDIDEKVKKFAYADITNDSAFEKEENEILFTMGSVFKILSVDEETDSHVVWKVRLKPTDEEDAELKNLTEHLKKDLFDNSYNLLASLATLTMKMGKWKNAEEFSILLLNDSSITDDFYYCSSVHSHLGVIYSELNQQSKAIDHHEQAINVLLRHLPGSKHLLNQAYNSMGKTCYDIGKFENALLYYHKALDMEQSLAKSDNNLIAVLYNNIGLVYYGQKRYLEALEVYNKALPILLIEIPSNHPEMAILYNNVAQTQLMLNEGQKAADYYYRAMEIQEKSLPHEHPHFAAIFNNLGTAFHKQGRLEEALNWFNKSQHIHSKVLPPNHPDIAIYHTNIGEIYLAQRQYTKAIECHEKALEIRLNSLPPSHSDIIVSYYNLGSAYYTEGNFEKALPMFEKSIEIHKKSLPHINPIMAKVYNNLGMVHYQLGDHATSIKYFSTVLEIQHESLMIDHVDIAVTYNNLAMVANKQGKFQEALKMLKSSLNNLLKLEPLDQPLFLSVCISISQVNSELGNYDEAIEYQKKALPMFSPNSEELGVAFQNLGNLYYKQNKLGEAANMFERSLAVYSQLLPNNDSFFISLYNNLASVHCLLGNHKKLTDYSDKLLAFRINTISEDGLSLAVTYHNLGQQSYRQGKYNEALEIFEKSLQLELKTQPPNHIRLATLYSDIAETYSQLGNCDQSIEYLEKNVSLLPPDNEDLGLRYYDLGNLYHKQGNLQQSASMYEKSLEVLYKILPKNDLQLASVCNTLAYVYNQLSDYTKVEVYLEQALKIQTNTLSPDNAKLITTYYNLGETKYEQRKYSEALELLEKSVQLGLDTVASSSKLAAVFYKIALIYLSNGNFTKATLYLDKILEKELELLLPDHPDLSNVYYHLANAYFGQRKYKEALQNMRTKYHIDSINFPKDDPQVQFNVYVIAILEILQWYNRKCD